MKFALTGLQQTAFPKRANKDLKIDFTISDVGCFKFAGISNGREI